MRNDDEVFLKPQRVFGVAMSFAFAVGWLLLDRPLFAVGWFGLGLWRAVPGPSLADSLGLKVWGPLFASLIGAIAFIAWQGGENAATYAAITIALLLPAADIFFKLTRWSRRASASRS